MNKSICINFDNIIKYNYIIYHKQCFDGYTGFYLFLKSKNWTPKPIVYPDIPSTKYVPENIDGKNIISIDVAYSPNIIEEICKKANHYTFIDHHKTNINEIKNLAKKYNNLSVIYNNDESGSSLTWKTFFPERVMPRFVSYIKDNDIGKWEIKETYDFIAALEVNFSLEPDFKILKHWDNLLNDSYLDELIKKGNIYNEYKNYLIKKNKIDIKMFPSKNLVIKNSLLDKVGKYKVGVVMKGCPSPSLVGKYVMDNYEDLDFCIIWFYNLNKNSYSLSLRSRTVDVGEIAKLLGGGGHKLASGCSLPRKMKIKDIFSD